MAEKKITKANVLNAIIALAQDVPADTVFEVEDATVAVDDIVAYAEKTLEQLAAKAAKAKEKAAEKAEANDELGEEIFAVLDAEPKAIADILAALDNADLTSAKVVFRLSKLVKAGRVDKADIKVGERKVKGYFVVSAE